MGWLFFKEMFLGHCDISVLGIVYQTLLVSYAVAGDADACRVQASPQSEENLKQGLPTND